MLGWQNPVGKKLFQPDGFYQIIGIIKNFHYRSLHKNIEPLAIRYLSSDNADYMTIRIRPEFLNESIDFIQNNWNNFAPGHPFNYFFFDRDFNRQYNIEQKTGRVLTAFSILSVFIACLGLFGLSSFITDQRSKEISIRKVLGSSVTGILMLLTREFTRLVIIANLIAWPAAYFFVTKWLENFAYRITVGFEIFIFSGILALMIALITVCSQSLKTAVSNPVIRLRDE